MRKTYFESKALCTSIKIVTAIFTLMFLGMPLYFVLIGGVHNAPVIIIILFPLIWLLTLATIIRGYELTDTQIIVKRLCYENRFDIQEGAKSYQQKLIPCTHIRQNNEGVWIDTPQKKLLITPKKPK